MDGGLWGGLSETEKAAHEGEQEKEKGDFGGADDLFHIESQEMSSGRFA
jgi:hypothetical protein